MQRGMNYEQSHEQEGISRAGRLTELNVTILMENVGKTIHLMMQ